MAISYPPLLSALMALSAIHRNSLYTNLPAALQQPTEVDYLKASSVAQLRSDLLLPSQPRPKMRDAVLATALTLCMCEIHSGADLPRSWRLHLEGATAIISSLSASSSFPHPHSQTGLLQRWYTSISALAALSPHGLRAGDLQPTTSPSPVPESHLSASNEKEEASVFLDDYFGFNTDLVDTFKEIGAAAWERRVLSSPSAVLASGLASTHAHINLSEEDLVVEARSLELRILGMMARDAIAPPSFYPGVKEKLDEGVKREFYLCNEAYHCAALLHVYRAVMLLETPDARVQGCVERILKCVDGIQPREGLSPYIVLTMPLFAAGREAMGKERERIRAAMRGLGECLRLRNVWRSLDILEDGWEKGSGDGLQGM
jgi:Fungal specific transcription factor domain